MARYVTVDENTGKIVGVGQATNVAQLGEPSLGQRHIFESHWAVTVPPQSPGVGDEWNGEDPTTFTTPVVDPNAFPATAQEAWNDIQMAKAAVTQAEAIFATMQGLNV
jgi:hypothetical protein